ncbi:MAG: glycosyltransferase family 4 protein [bacterium]|nr:glycosyltransferase family 4 protein [bacterium]
MIIPFLHYQTGGMERQSWQLAHHLLQRGIEVHFITGMRLWERWTRSLPVSETKDGIVIHRLPGLYPPNGNKFWPLELILGAARVFQRERFDIVHAHQLFSAGLAAASLRHVHKAPIVAKVAGGGSDGDIADIRRWPFTKTKLRRLDRMDRFIAITPQISEELAGIGITEDRIANIPNGVDTKKFKTSQGDKRIFKQKLNLPDAPLLLFVGRIVPTKQVDRLLSAWPSVLQTLPKAKLLLLGKSDRSTSYGAKIQSMINASWKNSVIFQGTVEDTGPWLQAADAFVLPSRAEGLSNALLEAAASGLPIVASDIPANRHVLEPGSSALMFSPNNTNDLAKQIIQVLTQPKLAADLGRQARRKIEKDFSLESVADAYVRLYEELRLSAKD